MFFSRLGMDERRAPRDKVIIDPNNAFCWFLFQLKFLFCYHLLDVEN